MPALPDGSHIGSVTLAVSDLDRSTAFYADTLGFQAKPNIGLHRSGPRGVSLSAGRHVLIDLVERPGAKPKPRRSAGLFHAAILVPSRAALGRSLRHLFAQHWPLTGAADHWVSEAVYLNDPDGLGLEIYRDRPREEWPRRGDRLLMSTEAIDLDDIKREFGADTAWDGLEEGTRIGHVHLQVSSLESAEALYCRDIGFTPTVRDLPGALFVAAGGYHHHVGLNIWAGGGAPPPPEGAAGLVSFEVLVPGVTYEHARTVADVSTGATVEVRPL